MSTASNNKNELFLDQIECEVFRVAKKDASVHALAIGFSQSKEYLKQVLKTRRIVSIPPNNIPILQVIPITSSFSNSCRAVRPKIANPIA